MSETSPSIISDAMSGLKASSENAMKLLNAAITAANDMREASDDIVVRMNLDRWIAKANKAKKMSLQELPGYFGELLNQWPLSSGAKFVDGEWVW